MCICFLISHTERTNTSLFVNYKLKGNEDTNKTYTIIFIIIVLVCTWCMCM